MKKLFVQLRNKIPASLTMHQWIFISSAFSILLMMVKILVSHRLSYAFLAWNLLLAYIPFLISNWLSKNLEVLKDKIRLVFAIVVWILFMPNSFYIVTDFFHLQNSQGKYPWFDLTLIFSFAWNGILFGIISIRRMELVLERAKGKVASGLAICLVMWFNAIGVYIGRFLRFNSWDVVINPLPLLNDLMDLVTDPYDHKRALAMSFCFASFMIIIYYTTKQVAELFKSS